jgi:CBS domain-containing protein
LSFYLADGKALRALDPANEKSEFKWYQCPGVRISHFPARLRTSDTDFSRPLVGTLALALPPDHCTSLGRIANYSDLELSRDPTQGLVGISETGTRFALLGAGVWDVHRRFLPKELIMRTATQSLLSLVAADVMSTRLVTIPEEMSLQGAARLLSRSNVSGAPVVDVEGRCVGVLSANDFVSWAEKGEHSAKHAAEPSDCVYSAWQVIDTEMLPKDAVSRHMTGDPVTVTPSAPIDQVARMMVDAHIHRVIVANTERRPVGIVSSTDILAAVAYAREKGP